MRRRAGAKAQGTGTGGGCYKGAQAAALGRRRRCGRCAAARAGHAPGMPQKQGRAELLCAAPAVMKRGCVPAQPSGCSSTKAELWSAAEALPGLSECAALLALLPVAELLACCMQGAAPGGHAPPAASEQPPVCQVLIHALHLAAALNRRRVRAKHAGPRAGARGAAGGTATAHAPALRASGAGEGGPGRLKGHYADLHSPGVASAGLGSAADTLSPPRKRQRRGFAAAPVHIRFSPEPAAAPGSVQAERRQTGGAVKAASASDNADSQSSGSEEGDGDAGGASGGAAGHSSRAAGAAGGGGGGAGGQSGVARQGGRADAAAGVAGARHSGPGASSGASSSAVSKEESQDESRDGGGDDGTLEAAPRPAAHPARRAAAAPSMARAGTGAGKLGDPEAGEGGSSTSGFESSEDTSSDSGGAGEDRPADEAAEQSPAADVTGEPSRAHAGPGAQSEGDPEENGSSSSASGCESSEEESSEGESSDGVHAVERRPGGRPAEANPVIMPAGGAGRAHAGPGAQGRGDPEGSGGSESCSGSSGSSSAESGGGSKESDGGKRPVGGPERPNSTQGLQRPPAPAPAAPRGPTAAEASASSSDMSLSDESDDGSTGADGQARSGNAAQALPGAAGERLVLGSGDSAAAWLVGSRNGREVGVSAQGERDLVEANASALRERGPASGEPAAVRTVSGRNAGSGVRSAPAAVQDNPAVPASQPGFPPASDAGSDTETDRDSGPPGARPVNGPAELSGLLALAGAAVLGSPGNPAGFITEGTQGEAPRRPMQGRADAGAGRTDWGRDPRGRAGDGSGVGRLEGGAEEEEREASPAEAARRERLRALARKPGAMARILELKSRLSQVSSQRGHPLGYRDQSSSVCRSRPSHKMRWSLSMLRRGPGLVARIRGENLSTLPQGHDLLSRRSTRGQQGVPRVGGKSIQALVLLLLLGHGHGASGPVGHHWPDAR